MKIHILESVVIAVAGFGLFAGGAMALPLDASLDRPQTVGAAPAGENSLQTELDDYFGSGVVDAYNDQLAQGMFSVSTPGSSLIAPQFAFEWTANSSSQTVGIFGWDGNNPVDSQIFSGDAVAGYSATVNWTSQDAGVISRFDEFGVYIGQENFSDIDSDFFGF